MEATLRLSAAAWRQHKGGVEAALRLSAAAWEQRVRLRGPAGAVEAAWELRGSCVEGLEAACQLGQAYSRVEAAWGLHLNSRKTRMYVSYFVLVNALVFVLERLIWYLGRYLVMSLLQHLFVSLKNMIGINLWTRHPETGIKGA